ncbi:MAG: DUF2534 family protein [Klebsiella pneumoniae]|nr:DUF2534 family protein [Klebsiella pneumoniae]
MILQKLLSNKNCKKYCLSLATSMFFLQGAMVTVYSIVFTALFAIPLGFIFLGADRQD